MTEREAALMADNNLLRVALRPFAQTWEKVPVWMRSARENRRRIVEDCTVEGESLLLNSAEAFEAAHKALDATPEQSLEAIEAGRERAARELRAMAEALLEFKASHSERIWAWHTAMERCIAFCRDRAVEIEQEGK